MRKAKNVVWTCNNPRSFSRFELLNWVNYTLCTDLVKIEEMCSGAGYCQLFDMLFNNVIPINKVKFSAYLEYQYINNFKLLQEGFKKVCVSKDVPINDLVKSSYQANFVFLQWFRKFFEANCDDYTLVNYDPIERRNGRSIITGISNKTYKQKSKIDTTPSNQTFTLHVGSQSSRFDMLPINSPKSIITNKTKSSNCLVKKKLLKKVIKKHIKKHISPKSSVENITRDVKVNKSFKIGKASKALNIDFKSSFENIVSDVKKSKSFIIVIPPRRSCFNLRNSGENKVSDVESNKSFIIRKTPRNVEKNRSSKTGKKSRTSRNNFKSFVKNMASYVKENKSFIIEKKPRVTGINLRNSGENMVSDVESNKSFIIGKTPKASNNTFKNSVKNMASYAKENKPFTFGKKPKASSIKIKNSVKNMASDIEKNRSFIIGRKPKALSINFKSSAEDMTSDVKGSKSFVIGKVSRDLYCNNSIIKTIDEIIAGVHSQINETRFLKMQRNLNFTRLCYLEKLCHRYAKTYKNVSEHILDIIYESDNPTNTPGMIPKE